MHPLSLDRLACCLRRCILRFNLSRAARDGAAMAAWALAGARLAVVAHDAEWDPLWVVGGGLTDELIAMLLHVEKRSA